MNSIEFQYDQKIRKAPARVSWDGSPQLMGVPTPAIWTCYMCYPVLLSQQLLHSLLCANDFVQPPKRQPQAPQLQHWQPFLHLLPRGVPASSPKPGRHGRKIGCKKQPLQNLCQGMVKRYKEIIICYFLCVCVCLPKTNGT